MTASTRAAMGRTVATTTGGFVRGGGLGVNSDSSTGRQRQAATVFGRWSPGERFALVRFRLSRRADPIHHMPRSGDRGQALDRALRAPAGRRGSLDVNHRDTETQRRKKRGKRRGIGLALRARQRRLAISRARSVTRSLCAFSVPLCLCLCGEPYSFPMPRRSGGGGWRSRRPSGDRR